MATLPSHARGPLRPLLFAFFLIGCINLMPREAEARQVVVYDTVRVAFQDGVSPAASYSGTRDTKLRSDAATTAFGDANFLEVDAGPDYASLISWDLSSIPDSASVIEATLVLNVTNVSTASYQLYSVLRSWDESSATWNEFSAGLPWASPGADGDQDRTRLSLTDIDGPLLGTLRIPLGNDGRQIVQDWISDPSSNNGFVVQNFDTADDGLDFSSREALLPEARPRLELTYGIDSGARLASPPEALFDVNNIRGIGTGEVELDASPSNLPGTAITSWVWDFGDQAMGIGQTASYSYAAPGAYEIRLTVTDTLGVSDTSTRIIIVDEGEEAQASFQQGMFPLPSYEGATDTKVREDQASTNFGNDVSLFIDGSPLYATLMRWDLTAIAPGVEVTQATISYEVVDATSDQYSMYPALSPWVETEATWMISGSGAPWAFEGANGTSDRGEEPLGVISGGELGTVSFDFNQLGREWIARWINEPATNHGLVIQNFDGAEDGLDFLSSEAPDERVRPRLDLSYQVAHHVNQPERLAFDAWPNPFGNDVSVMINTDIRHPVELELYDILGRRILSDTISPARFRTGVKLDTSFLSAGVYAVVLTEHGDWVSETKMITKGR